MSNVVKPQPGYSRGMNLCELAESGDCGLEHGHQRGALNKQTTLSVPCRRDSNVFRIQVDKDLTF